MKLIVVKVTLRTIGFQEAIQNSKTLRTTSGETLQNGSLTQIISFDPDYFVCIGDVLLEIGAHCHPYSRMETALDKGGFLAMYMRGGYCCKVIKSGSISVSDIVERITSNNDNSNNNNSNQQGSLF